MSERHGVEVDYCPKCRGVWLDRGELDKIIDRADEDFDSDRRERFDPDHREHERRYEPRSGYEHGHRKKKRKSFLEDIFELG